MKRSAVYMLSRLSCWPDDKTQADAEERALELERVSELLDSSDSQIRRWTCEMVGNMTSSGSTSVVQLGARVAAQILVLLKWVPVSENKSKSQLFQGDQDERTREAAMFTISSMNFRDADLEVDDPKMLKYFREHLHSLTLESADSRAA
jgi:hypothetical protein